MARKHLLKITKKEKKRWENCPMPNQCLGVPLFVYNGTIL